MKGFTPVKKHATKFRYTPRFYDPRKEERDERRAELRGTTSASAGEEYTPGDYIKRQSDARSRGRSGRSNGGASPFMMKVFIAAMVFLLAYILLPRIIGAFNIGSSAPAQVEQSAASDEFDPYAPIRIVPNDYQGE